MLYNCGNTHPNTRVYDVDTKEEFKAVLYIDTDSGEMLMHTVPIEVDTNMNEVKTITMRYRTISAIFGGYPLPCLFHCYGRL